MNVKANISFFILLSVLSGVVLGQSTQNIRGKVVEKHTQSPIAYALGCFYSEEDAARAYDAKALELYGEDAKLNFSRK